MIKTILFTLLIIAIIVIVSIYKFNFTDTDNYLDTAQDNETTKSSKQVNQISNNESVSLSNQGLEKIPTSVFSKTNIEQLDVSNNVLTGSIQAEIRQLTNLKILNASNNDMTGIPAEIGQLQELEILDLSNNKLTGLPYELGNLKNLKTLNLSGNAYSIQDLNIIRSSLPPTANIIID